MLVGNLWLCYKTQWHYSRTSTWICRGIGKKLKFLSLFFLVRVVGTCMYVTRYVDNYYLHCGKNCKKVINAGTKSDRYIRTHCMLIFPLKFKQKLIVFFRASFGTDLLTVRAVHVLQNWANVPQSTVVKALRHFASHITRLISIICLKVKQTNQPPDAKITSDRSFRPTHSA